jgi:hypothetical protein
MADAPQCGICKPPAERRTVIESMLAAGRSANFIEGEMKRLGQPTKAETVTRHLRLCLKGNPVNSSLVIGSPDFAAAVQARAQEMMDNGELKVRTQDGLAAQALLDRRAEKAADRDLMLNLARLMSGARSAVPVEVIEGTYRELTDDEVLAPNALVLVE